MLFHSFIRVQLSLRLHFPKVLQLKWTWWSAWHRNPWAAELGGWGAPLLQEAAQRSCGIYQTRSFPQVALPRHSRWLSLPNMESPLKKAPSKNAVWGFTVRAIYQFFNCGMQYDYINHEKSQKSSICFSVSECRNAPRARWRTGSLVRLTLAGNLWVRIQSLLLAG